MQSRPVYYFERDDPLPEIIVDDGLIIIGSVGDETRLEIQFRGTCGAARVREFAAKLFAEAARLEMEAMS